MQKTLILFICLLTTLLLGCAPSIDEGEPLAIDHITATPTSNSLEITREAITPTASPTATEEVENPTAVSTLQSSPTPAPISSARQELLTATPIPTATFLRPSPIYWL